MVRGQVGPVAQSQVPAGTVFRLGEPAEKPIKSSADATHLRSPFVGQTGGAGNMPQWTTAVLPL